MDKTEMDGLFELLKIYFANSEKPRSRTLKNAWFLVLEPYDAKDVKNAVIQCLREKKYFPDVADIAAKCPLPRDAEISVYVPAATEVETRWLREWCAAWRDQLHAAGLQTASEAKADGVSSRDWYATLDTAGL